MNASKKSRQRSKPATVLAPETAAIRREIKCLLDTIGDNGKRIGSAKYGVYAFFDYFDEPIYVGQTKEKLGTRIRRHLTNQRTDAVAMGVLDPGEVAEVEIWPLDLQGKSKDEIKESLERAEYTVYRKVLEASKLKAVLNEKEIPRTSIIALPKSLRRKIVPEPWYSQRCHPDIRVARRAAQIAELARIVTERDVSKGLRRTLHFQAVRLESLTSQRLNEIAGPFPIECEGDGT